VAPEEEDERGCTSERSERRGRGGGGARGGEKEPEGSGTKSRVAEGMGDGMDEGHTGEAEKGGARMSALIGKIGRAEDRSTMKRGWRGM